MKQISLATAGQKRANSAQKSSVTKQKSVGPSRTTTAVVRLVLDSCCKLFPPMEHDDYIALKASIERNGQHQPLLVWEGRVLDGRHRLKACSELGIRPLFEQVTCSYEEAKSMAFAANINRRHLAVGPRALLAAQLATRKPGQTKASKEIQPVLTQQEAAKLFAVSRDAVQRGCRLLAEASKDTLDGVHTGSISLNEAIVSLNTGKSGLRAKTTEEERKALLVAAVVKERLGRESRILRLVKQAATSSQNMALPSGVRHSVVLADPPWDYGMANDRSASRIIPHTQYAVMSVDAMISDINVGSISADDAMLFMWCPASLLPDGLRLMTAWGFNYSSNWVWHKSGGKLNCGGGTATVHHELLLVGKRGAGLTIVDKKARESSVFSAPVTVHSAKPAVVHERLEALYPDVSRIELFSRAQRKGWTMFGNQVGELVVERKVA